ncbi:MAG: hypothetical protein ACI90V_006482 [Bacillariaceae sp.]|jgi:hypothetical protein
MMGDLEREREQAEKKKEEKINMRKISKATNITSITTKQ